MFVAHLRVTSAFLAITAAPDHSFVTIPTGAMIESPDEFAEPGFVHVLFDGKELLAFTRDIRERTTQPQTPAA